MMSKKRFAKKHKMIVQNEADAKRSKSKWFKNVEVLKQDTVFEGIQLVKTKGEHGRGEELLNLMGEVCGVVLKHPSEKVLYVAGDTLW